MYRVVIVWVSNSRCRKKFLVCVSMQHVAYNVRMHDICN